MSLIISPPSWAYCTDNLGLTPSATANTIGTGVTPGTSNADGTAVTLLTTLAHDVEFIVLGVGGFSAVTANNSTLLDIMVDPAGGTSWASFIDDLLVGETLGTSVTGPMPQFYFFPVFIKAGTSIGMRARCAHTVSITQGRVTIQAFGGNANPGSWWCGQRVSSFGITAASSMGTAHTPGNTDVYSSWADLGSPLTADAGALQYVAQGTFTDTTQNNAIYVFQFGVGDQRIGPNIYRATSTNELAWIHPSGPIFSTIKNGSQLRVRGKCSGTAEIIDVAAYAVH